MKGIVCGDRLCDYPAGNRESSAWAWEQASAMPKKIATYRILDERLNRFLSSSDGVDDVRWPKYERLISFIRNELREEASERQFKKLREEGVADEKVVSGLIAYLRVRQSSLLASFAAREGIVLPDEHSALVEMLSTPQTEEQLKGDGLERGAWPDIPGMLMAALLPHESPPCRDLTDVDLVCEWNFLDVGRRIAVDSQEAGKSIDPYLSAATRMQRTLREFQAQGRNWHQASEWTIARTVVKGTTVGASIVLPLRDRVYEEVRAGQRSDLDIGNCDLVYPSPHLLVVGFCDADRPAFPLFSARRVATRLLVLYWQILELAGWTKKNQPVQSIRLLAIAGTPDRQPVLQKFGWLPTGTMMKGFDVPLYELTVSHFDDERATSSSGLHRWVLNRIRKSVLTRA